MIVDRHRQRLHRAFRHVGHAPETAAFALRKHHQKRKVAKRCLRDRARPACVADTPSSPRSPPPCRYKITGSFPIHCDTGADRQRSDAVPAAC